MNVAFFIAVVILAWVTVSHVAVSHRLSLLEREWRESRRASWPLRGWIPGTPGPKEYFEELSNEARYLFVIASSSSIFTHSIAAAVHAANELGIRTAIIISPDEPSAVDQTAWSETLTYLLGASQPDNVNYLVLPEPSPLIFQGTAVTGYVSDGVLRTAESGLNSSQAVKRALEAFLSIEAGRVMVP